MRSITTNEVSAQVQPLQTFAVALFDRKNDNAPRQCDLSRDELRAILTNHSTRADKDGPLFSPARFQTGKPRRAENVLDVSCCVLDFDGGADPLDITRKLDEQDLCYIVCSTWSHTPEEPKFRVVIPLAATVAGAQWQEFYKRAVTHYGQDKADPKCKDASRIFYLPACPSQREADAWSFYQPGERLLHPDDLPTTPQTDATSERRATQSQTSATIPDTLRPYVRAVLSRELAAVSGAADGQRNDTLNRASYALGTIVGAGELEMAQVEADLINAATAANLPEAEARATIRSGLKAGQQKPRVLPAPSHSGNTNANSHQAAPQLKGNEQAPKKEISLDEIGNGERFATQHGAELRFCSVREQWQTYKAGHWQPDEHGEAERRAKKTGRDVAAEAAKEPNDDRRARLLKHALTLTKRATRETMLKDAASEPRMTVTPEDFDNDLHLFNLANGTLDLKTLEFRTHNPADLLTRQSPVYFDLKAEYPTWCKCLERWIPDEETRKHLQDLAGVSLSGQVFDEFFVFLYGDGDNGKSTFLRVLEWLLGTYGHKTQAETIMQAKDKRKSEAPSPELLALKGARLVTVHEIDNKHTLNAALIKDLTGRDRITARGLFEKRPTTFDPQFTLWMFGNGKPKIEDTSGGMWRRPRLIPFGQPIPTNERDPLLSDKLRAELPGILNWALEGLKRVHSQGLPVPEAVTRAVAEYRAEQDALASFIAERCVIGAQCTASALELWEAWKDWCAQNGEREGTQRAFGAELKKQSRFEPYAGNAGRRWRGIGLLKI